MKSLTFETVKVPYGGVLNVYLRHGTGPDYSDALVLKEAFEENTYGLHEDQFKHTGIFVDIGANIGIVSLLAWTMGATKIIAYEPEPDNYELLLRNMEANPKAPIESHKKAVWSCEASLPLVPRQGGSTSEAGVVADRWKDVTYVPAVTLAYVLEEFEDIDVLKVDTEGAEYEILRDRQVNQKARRIVLEYHTTTEAKFGKLLATLSLTHNIQVFGHYDTDGGQVLGVRY